MIARDWHFYPFLREIGLKPARPEKLLLASTDNPNFIVDITDTIDKKIKAKDSDFEYGEAFYDMAL